MPSLSQASEISQGLGGGPVAFVAGLFGLAVLVLFGLLVRSYELRIRAAEARAQIAALDALEKIASALERALSVHEALNQRALNGGSDAQG